MRSNRKSSKVLWYFKPIYCGVNFHPYFFRYKANKLRIKWSALSSKKQMQQQHNIALLLFMLVGHLQETFYLIADVFTAPLSS